MGCSPLAGKWFNLAASQGNPEAKNAYSKLSEIMFPEKISEAPALGKKFVPQNADKQMAIGVLDSN